MEKIRKHLKAYELSVIVKLFDSMYDDFSSGSLTVKMVKNDLPWKPGDNIRTILKTSERNPMATLKYILRNPIRIAHFIKTPWLSQMQTHQVIDITCGLIYSICNELVEAVESVKKSTILREYVYVKLAISTCVSIINTIQGTLRSSLTLNAHSQFLKICNNRLHSIHADLEKIANVSEHYDNIIRVLTSKILCIDHKLSLTLFNNIPNPGVSDDIPKTDNGPIV